MKIEGDCPVCEGPLSIWDGCKAKTPFVLMCPHCMSKVLVKAPLLKFCYTLVVIAFAGLAAGALFSLVTFQFGTYFVWLIWMAVLLAVAQIVVCLLSFNVAELEPGEPDF